MFVDCYMMGVFATAGALLARLLRMTPGRSLPHAYCLMPIDYCLFPNPYSLIPIP